MKMVLPFFFWLQILQAIRCEGPFPTATPIKHKIPYSESENIRESNLDFTAHFGEINPDMLYLCRRSLSGPKKAVFAFFPSTRRKSIKKTLNLRFFAKKTSKFLISLPFKKQIIDNQLEYDAASASSSSME